MRNNFIHRFFYKHSTFYKDWYDLKCFYDFCILHLDLVKSHAYYSKEFVEDLWPKQRGFLIRLMEVTNYRFDEEDNIYKKYYAVNK